MQSARCGLLAALFSVVFSLHAQEPQLSSIKLPPGFHIQYYAKDVPAARSMALCDNGTLFVGTRDDKVYAIPASKSGKSGGRVVTLLTDLNTPNGVAVKDGALYIAEISRILRYEDIENHLSNAPKPVVLPVEYPSDEAHGWKFIRFGPDGKLYIPVGMPCNVCKREDPRFGTITRIKPDGSGFEIYASGIRNTVGFDWHPVTHGLWFTDNGRDWMGDNKPPDELNYAPKKGMNFGFPYVHGDSIMDPEFGKGHSADEFTAPAQELGPHVAALGMRFYTGSMFPKEYRNQIFIAEHGSWNRSVPIGYRVTVVTLNGNKPTSYKPFAEGWLQGSSAWGRPVDVQVMPDGALLVSDDKAGCIYRISYGK